MWYVISKTRWIRNIQFVLKFWTRAKKVVHSSIVIVINDNWCTFLQNSTNSLLLVFEILVISFIVYSGINSLSVCMIINISPEYPLSLIIRFLMKYSLLPLCIFKTLSKSTLVGRTVFLIKYSISNFRSRNQKDVS